MRLLLDSDAGTLTVKKNGVLLGVAGEHVRLHASLGRVPHTGARVCPVTTGLTGGLCWMVSAYQEDIAVRIEAVDPEDF